MIQAGSLNRRLAIYAPADTTSDTGAVKMGRRKQGEVWASLDGLTVKDSNRMAGRVEAAEARFTIRYLAGINTLNEVVCNKRRYSVVEVEEIGLREGLKLLVRAI